MDRILPKDTSVEAARVMYAALGRMSIDRRARIVCEMNENVRKIAEAGIKQRHPDYDERQVKLAGIKIWLGRELFEKAHPNVKIEP